ncbi:MAG: tRNA 2-thiouridine(34) synthase MnmA [Patescibacteria group bacterium]|nr:tRNA 2-thiouridine(34) synthase MnmA [Patescibacteria group bacterium]
MKDKKKKILVGMSGGVDSSVAAALLLRQGYEVIGGFIKNWSDTKDLATGECAWKSERRDAIRVAAKLGIPLMTFDFEKEYRQKVVEEIFRGYEAGITPNPDVLCNQYIKFGLFLDAADKVGADFIATGHYARVKRDKDGEAHLFRGLDQDKDQSYFLCRITQRSLRRTFFPVGDLKKTDVRHLAQKFKLPVFDKPDSQGICFMGKLDMVEFLRKKIPSKPGDIVDDKGKVLGRHSGLDAYTIGQRQRILVSNGAQAWYVADKDVQENRLVVVAGADHPLLYAKYAEIGDFCWISGKKAPVLPLRCQVQIRYRQEAVGAKISKGQQKGELRVDFEQPVKAVSPGQSAVAYKREECLGGGIIIGT